MPIDLNTKHSKDINSSQTEIYRLHTITIKIPQGFLLDIDKTIIKSI